MPFKNKEEKNQYQRDWRRKNKEKSNEYSKKYRQKHKSKINNYFKKYYNKNKSDIKEKNEKWEKENKGYHNKYNKRYSGSKQVKARNLANYRIKFSVQQLCQRCNEKLAIAKHHPDYNQPLCVRFLCKECHKIEDNLPNLRSINLIERGCGI